MPKTFFSTVFNMSNFLLTKHHLCEVLVLCYNWKKSSVEAYCMFVDVYGDATPTDKHPGKVFDVSRIVISAWKSSLSLHSQKNEDKDFVAGWSYWMITLWRSVLNSTRFCIIIGNESTSRFQLKSMGMIEKQGNWAPYELAPSEVKKRFYGNVLKKTFWKLSN